MRVLFRVDASISIGSGHVMRCLTLAHALKSRGAQVLFICRASGGDLGGLLRDQGIEVAWLVAPSAKADAEQTLDVMALHAFGTGDWVVLDHYGLSRAWESTIRRSGSRILVIDDLANRPHDCDLLLDQNLVADYQARYAGLVAEETITLLGPRYAMLQPSYREAHQTARRRSGRPRRIMVFFGGADLPDMTTKVVEALLQRPEDVVVDMVVGAANPKRELLLDLAAANPRIVAHTQLPSLTGLMLQADLSIGAGGATTWERLCLRLPGVVVTLADNQRPVAAEMQRRGFAIWAGDAEDLADMPAEYQHEPALALGSGEDGLDLTRRMLAEAADYLNPNGLLFIEVGNSAAALAEAFPELPLTWLEFELGGHGICVISREDLMG